MAKFPIRPIQIHFFQKMRFWANERLSHHDFLQIFFKLVALSGMIVGYSQGHVVLTGEGGRKFWITLYVSCWRLVINCSPLLPRMLKICPQIFIVAASLESVTICQSCIIPVHLRRWSPLISSCSVLVVLSFSSCWIIRVSPSLWNSRVSSLWKSIHVFRVVGNVTELLKDFTRGVAVYELCSCWLWLVNWPFTTNCVLVKLRTHELVVAVTSLHACFFAVYAIDVCHFDGDNDGFRY